MGVNAQTSVPLYTASEVLTAANMNISAGTGVPVFATTVTRDAAFGGANEKVLAEGQLCYLESTDVVQQYNGASWVTVGPSTAGGLVFISATSMSGASVSVNNCFTSTYDNYRLLFSPSAITVDTAITFRLRLSGTDSSTGYLSQRVGSSGATAFGSANVAGTDEMIFGNGKPSPDAQTASCSVDIFSPAQARSTVATSSAGTVEGANNVVILFYNAHTPATAYDGFTMLAAGGSFTGTIYLYGYAKA